MRPMMAEQVRGSISHRLTLKLSKPKISRREIVPYSFVREPLGSVDSLHFVTSISNTLA